jgi:hypothetical protein
MLSTIQALQMVDALVQSDHWDRQTADSVVLEVSLLSPLHFWGDLDDLLARLKASKKITVLQALQVRHYLNALDVKRELPALRALHAQPQLNQYFIASASTGVASSVAPRPDPRADPRADPRSAPALRVKHLKHLQNYPPKTLAPKRQPPRPPRPPGGGCADDACADDQQWDYSWRLVVPVGSQPGEWPQDSALELAEESMSSVMENDADTHDWVREEVIRHLEALFVPVSAQAAEWWTRLRNTYEFAGCDAGGALLGDSNLNQRHLLYVYFRNDGNRVARDSWQAGRQSVTSVSIRYRGPAQLRPRHPREQHFTEYRLRPNQVSPVFGF